MKMANGGFNPAYNLQLATDADSRMIVGVQVTNSGSDSRQLAPMPTRSSAAAAACRTSIWPTAATFTSKVASRLRRKGSSYLSR
jgi:hypothetical protein